MLSLDARIRKQQSILICSGLGVILFGVWSAIRFALMVYLKDSLLWDAIESASGEGLVSDDALLLIIIISAAVVFSFDLLIRLYIGRAAIREGRGNSSESVKYIVMAMLYAALVFSSDTYAVIGYITKGGMVREYLDILIDFTVNIATVEIAVSAIRVRMLCRQKLKVKKEVY